MRRRRGLSPLSPTAAHQPPWGRSASRGSASAAVLMFPPPQSVARKALRSGERPEIFDRIRLGAREHNRNKEITLYNQTSGLSALEVEAG